MVAQRVPAEPVPEITESRRLFPATAGRAYLNTAAVGLASRRLARTYHAYIDAWTSRGLDYVRGEQAANEARSVAARLIGADPADVTLIPSVSAAAGLVAAQLGTAARGENVVIGEREYSSNHYPWRQLATKGYDVRQVPFRGGGLDPEDVAARLDGGTRLVAFSAVQSSTGHRSDIAAISAHARAVGALVYVDGSQLVGALAVSQDLPHVDVLATSDHKFLLNAGRGMGYCYLSREAQARFTPINAGWRAGADPFTSFFGPEMQLSPTASRFDSGISWLAAAGNIAALSIFFDYGPDLVYARNRDLESQLRLALADVGWDAYDLPEANRSTIVSVPLAGADPAAVVRTLAEDGVICSARDGALRLSVHLYNHEDDIALLLEALATMRSPASA